MNTIKHEPKEYSDPFAWTITGDLPPRYVWDRIEAHHIRPLIRIYLSEGVALVPSMRSCYRSVAYELKKGRSGKSLHTFPAASRGACDLIRLDGVDVSSAIDLLVELGPWRRICYYRLQGFVHVDYGDQDGGLCGRRQLWECDGGSAPWRFASWLPEV
jgi:hypothetical protein